MNKEQQQQGIALIRSKLGTKNANHTIDTLVGYTPRGVYDYLKKFYPTQFTMVWAKGVERESGRQRQMADFLKGKYAVEAAAGKGDIWEIHFTQNVKGNA